MKKIATLVGRDLKWTQPRARRLEFELRAGDELAATLRFPSPLRTLAVGESGDGAWTFRRSGLFTNNVTIRLRDSGAEAALCRASAFRHGGTLKLADGRSLRVSGNFWGTRYSFADASGQPLMQVAMRGLIHHSATVTLRPGAANLPELPFVVLLGWYLSILTRNDGAAIANLG